MKKCLLLSLLVFLYLGIPLFGLFYYEPTQEELFQPTQVSVNNIQDSIRALQNSVATIQDSVKNLLAKNPNLNLQMQVNHLEDEVRINRDDVRHSINDYNNKMDHWLNKLSLLLTIMGILAAIFGFLVPYLERKDLASKIDKIQKNLDEAKGIKGDVKKTANDAKALQLFVEALNEPNTDKAIELYNQCLELLPDFAQAYNNRGVLYLKKGDKEKADNDFNKAISNGYIEAYLNLGLLNCQRGEKDKAKNDFDAAIAKKKDYAEAYYIRGLWRYINGEEIEGIDDIRTAREKKSDVIETYTNRDLLTNEMKKLDNALNGADYSDDWTKLNHVSPEKRGDFIVLNRVTEIEEFAFSLCRRINSIIIPESVTKIGKCAFWNCTSITSIDIPESVDVISNGIFYNCIKLNDITIHEGTSKIGKGAFQDCYDLVSITFPSSVTEIGSWAFRNCKSLTEIHFKRTTPVAFPQDAFDGLEQQEIDKITIYVPKGSGDDYRNNKDYIKYKNMIKEEESADQNAKILNEKV